MEIVTEKNALLGALSLVQGIVERRNTVPILGHVLIVGEGSKVALSATDLEVAIRTDFAAEVRQAGSITLNARKLLEVVREAESEKVALTLTEKEWVEVKCGRARFRMIGLDPRSFPSLPGKEAAGGQTRKAVKADIKVPATVLAAMIDKTIIAVSPDEARYNLSGVYLEGLGHDAARMVATDGHRLALVDREIKGFTMQGGALIPRKGLAEIRKLLDQAGDDEVNVVIDGQSAWLHRGTTDISMRLIEGEFPDYKGIIPKDQPHRLTVSRDALAAAIRRAAIFSSERYHGVRFALSPGNLAISSITPEFGEASDSIDVQYQGEELAIGFNALYVQQSLATIEPGADVVLELTDEVSPGVITTPSDSTYLYVVMPMRL